MKPPTRMRGRTGARVLIISATAGLAAAGAGIASAATGADIVSDGSTPQRAS